jgi:hypothetical protein
MVKWENCEMGFRKAKLRTGEMLGSQNGGVAEGRNG